MAVWVAPADTSMTVFPDNWRLVSAASATDAAKRDDEMRLTALMLFEALDELTHAVKRNERKAPIITEQINAVETLIEAEKQLWPNKRCC